MQRHPHATLATALTMVVVAGVAGACGDDADDADEGSSETTAMSTPTAGWEEVVPGGDCEYSDGSQYNLWVREGDPEKVVLYLEDGGACFSAETCDPDRELYKTAVAEGPNGEGGIFDYADARNPLADWSAVYAPYCTADVFLGNAVTEYTPDLIIHHKGYVNGTAALDELVGRFPEASEVVVIGESAGSIAAPLYAGLVADRLPDADVVALADGSGSYPDAPEITGLVADAWGTGDAIPDWPENADLTAERWSSFPGLFVQSGRHAPGVVFARHDFAYDEHQALWYPIVGLPVGDLLARIDANETRIEGAGVELLSYIAPGDGHTALTEHELYTEEVDGEPLLDWLTRLVGGEPVTDVHCTDCTAG